MGKYVYTEEMLDEVVEEIMSLIIAVDGEIIRAGEITEDDIKEILVTLGNKK